MAAGGAALALARLVNEDDWTDTVVEIAMGCGWLVYHARPARRRRGWRTATQGHTGFPDVIAVRPPRLVMAELKRVGERPGARQRVWLEALRRVPGVEVYVWTPADADSVRAAFR